MSSISGSVTRTDDFPCARTVRTVVNKVGLIFCIEYIHYITDLYYLLLHAMAWRQLKILKGKQSGVGLGGLRRCSKHFINTSSTLPGSAFALKLKKHDQFISKSLPQSSYLHSIELKKAMSLQSFCTSLQTEVCRQRTLGIFDQPF